MLLALDLAWYAVMAAAEVLRPRPRDDLRRWSTVFPLGMTAVAALSTAQAAHVRVLHSVGSVLLRIAVGAWLLTAAARSGARAGRVTAAPRWPPTRCRPAAEAEFPGWTQALEVSRAPEDRLAWNALVAPSGWR